MIQIFTQEFPKNQTLKHTKVDYAFLIETLLALQEIGLTKLPKKTWADIVFKSDDNSKIDLQPLIQKTKESKVICNPPKEKQLLTTISQRATPTPKSTVLQMESEYWEKNPFKATVRAFPSGFHFKPIAINKTRTFYEFIF